MSQSLIWNHVIGADVFEALVNGRMMKIIEDKQWRKSSFTPDTARHGTACRTEPRRAAVWRRIWRRAAPDRTVPCRAGSGVKVR